jgi:hypothetical protein
MFSESSTKLQFCSMFQPNLRFFHGRHRFCCCHFLFLHQLLLPSTETRAEAASGDTKHRKIFARSRRGDCQSGLLARNVGALKSPSGTRVRPAREARPRRDRSEALQRFSLGALIRADYREPVVVRVGLVQQRLAVPPDSIGRAATSSSGRACAARRSAAAFRGGGPPPARTSRMPFVNRSLRARTRKTESSSVRLRASAGWNQGRIGDRAPVCYEHITLNSQSQIRSIEHQLTEQLPSPIRVEILLKFLSKAIGLSTYESIRRIGFTQ